MEVVMAVFARSLLSVEKSDSMRVFTTGVAEQFPFRTGELEVATMVEFEPYECEKEVQMVIVVKDPEARTVWEHESKGRPFIVPGQGYGVLGPRFKLGNVFFPAPGTYIAELWIDGSLAKTCRMYLGSPETRKG